MKVSDDLGLPSRSGADDGIVIDEESVPVRAPRDATADARFGVSAIVRGVPAAVWLAAALFLAQMAVYTVLVPNYRPPDEFAHVDATVALAHGRAGVWPGPGELLRSKGVAAGGRIFSARTKSVFTEERAIPRPQRPSYDDADGDDTTPLENQMVQHPPGYYALMAGVLRMWPGWEHARFDLVVGLLRLVNALLVVSLPLLAFATVRRLAGPGPPAIAAACLPLAIPMLSDVGSGVNNDNLLILLVSVMTVGVVYVVTGDTSMRTAVVLGLLGAAALFTKGFALLVPPWLVATYAVAALRYDRRRAFLAGCVATGLATGLGGWWWVRNKVLYGKVQPDGSRISQAPHWTVTTWAKTGTEWLWNFLQYMQIRVWQEFRSPTPPRYLAIAATVATVFVVVFAVAAVISRRVRVLDSALLVWPPAVCFAIVAAGSWDAWTWSATYRGVQGRYLYAGVVGVGALVGLGGAVILRKHVRWLPLVIVAGGAVQHLTMLRNDLSWFWMPEQGGLSAAVRGMLAWAPWPVGVTAFLVVATFALAIALVVVLVRSALADARPPSEDLHPHEVSSGVPATV